MSRNVPSSTTDGIDKQQSASTSRPSTSTSRVRIAPLMFPPSMSQVRGVGGRGRARHTPYPIIRPKLTGSYVPQKGRPLIALLDKMNYEEQKQKPYYTEMKDILAEFEIPETFDTSSQTSVSGSQLAEKLKTLQVLRGENKFLVDAIAKKNYLCGEKSEQINLIRLNTHEAHNQCQVFRSTVQQLEAEIERLKRI